MKKLYFKSVKSLREFILLARSNEIKFEIPNKFNSGFLLCVEIPDDIKSDMFLSSTGFND